MDIQNLLNSIQLEDEQYEKQVFEYCPSSPSAWSSISSKTFLSEPIKTSRNRIDSSNSMYNNRKSKHQTRTPWTASEDYLLEKGYLQGLSWAMISAKYLPHRSRGCCWGRFKTLQTKSTERKMWTESEDRILLGAIRKHTKLFKHAWKTVAMDLNDRDWRECEIRSARISNILSHSRKSLP